MSRRANPQTVLHEIIRDGNDLAESTRERYLRDVDVWISFAGADPEGWTRKKAQDFYNHLIRQKRLRPQSANRLMASIQYAARWWAHQENNESLNFATVRTAGARDKIAKHAMSHEHAMALVGTCLHVELDAHRMRDLAIIVVGLETGMRRMSLQSMLIEDTLIDDDQVRARRAPYPLANVLVKGSNGARVPVPLSDTACRAIRPWRAWLLASTPKRTGPLFQGLDERDVGIVTTLPSGNELSATAIVAMLERRCEQAKIPRVNPHMFRHTFSTWRADAGLAPHEIAAITRHTITGIGALAGYLDLGAIGAKARNSTPDWLRELIP